MSERIPTDDLRAWARQALAGGARGRIARRDLEAHAPDLAAEVLELRAERDRLARILAVEQGDESAAPKGWSRVRTALEAMEAADAAKEADNV